MVRRETGAGIIKAFTKVDGVCLEFTHKLVLVSGGVTYLPWVDYLIHAGQVFDGSAEKDMNAKIELSEHVRSEKHNRAVTSSSKNSQVV